LATIRDVAKLAGVSVSTVSRVLNQNGYVNKETEQKVVAAISKLNYEPNAMARGLASKKTGTIAIILPDISNPFFPELARAVEDVARTYGYTVFLCNSDDHSDKEKSYIDVLHKKYIDGIIFASNTLTGSEIERMQKQNTPFVVLDRTPDQQSCSIVRSKNYLGGRLAVEHLLEVGCKKIAHIYGPQYFSTARERLMGYEDCVRGYDWFSPSLMIPGDFSMNGGKKAVEILFQRFSDVDGIFIGNDLMAVGALKVLNQKGIKVPDEMAICGFDGISLSEMIEPEITTIAQPIYEMGALATRILIKKIQGLEQQNQCYELDVKLVPRESTRRGTNP